MKYDSLSGLFVSVEESGKENKELSSFQASEAKSFGVGQKLDI